MTRIFKYDLDTRGGFLEIPLGAKLLSVALQGNLIKLWAEVDLEAIHVEVEYHCFNTGEELLHDDSLIYRGTVLLDNGLYVKHVYMQEPL